MVLDTIHARRMQDKPDVGELGYVLFPGTANNRLSWPNPAALADSALKWRVEVQRPANPGAGVNHDFLVAPLYVRWGVTGIAVIVQNTDGTFTAVTATWATLEADPDFPAVGGRLQVEGEWHPGTDTLTVRWRPALWDLATDPIFTSWRFGASIVAAGKMAPHPGQVTASVGSTAAGFAAVGKWYRAIRWTNGVLDYDVNAPADIVSDSATFVATTGQTVTTQRSGVPDLELVPSVREAGVPTGVGDWRIFLEQLVGTGGIVGAFTVGGASVPTPGDLVGSFEWDPLDDRVRGLESTRGADMAGQRDRVGTALVTLSNNDGAIDPWENYARVRPGTIVRAGLASLLDTRAGGWLPLWTCRVASWPVTYVGVGADSFCNVELEETLAAVARLDALAVAGAGGGEGMVPRVDRLLSADDTWKYGLVTLVGPDGPPTIPLQATTMAGNRIAELYLTADSSNAIVRSDKTGAALVTTRQRNRPTRLTEFSYFWFGGPITNAIPMIVLAGLDDLEDPPLWTIAYDADSIESANDTIPVRNDHNFARVGGTVQPFPHKVSQGRFGPASFNRSDLIMTTDADALLVAQETSDREALTALRIEAVTITDVDAGERILALAALDPGDEAWIFPPASSGFTGSGIGRIRTITHRITPMKGKLNWTTTIALDFLEFFEMPGAMLEPAPR